MLEELALGVVVGRDAGDEAEEQELGLDAAGGAAEIVDGADAGLGEADGEGGLKRRGVAAEGGDGMGGEGHLGSMMLPGKGWLFNGLEGTRGSDAVVGRMDVADAEAVTEIEQRRVVWWEMVNWR